MRRSGLVIMTPVLLTSICLTCSRDTERRKIRLADQDTTIRTEEQLTTTIHLESTSRRAIAVMFFENQTGDQNLQWLQKGLSEMFIRALSQSRNLSVLSTDRMYEILERLDETASTDNFNVDLAAVVAQEANVEAILTGNISRNGDLLKIDVEVREPNQGRILKEASVEGPGLENLFSMVDYLTEKIQSDLQISLDQEDMSKGITELSTNSLEAWRYYTAGSDFMDQFLLTDAIEQYKKAIEADPNFVSSYLNLCQLLYSQGETQQGYDTFQKLLKLRDKATPREKYRIDRLEAGIHMDVPRIIEVSQQWLKQYPDDRDANLNLASLYYGMQDYHRAMPYYLKVLDADPKYKIAYNMLGYIYANTGNYIKAIKTLNTYKTLAPDDPNPYDSIGEIYFYQGNFKQAEKYFKQALEVNDKANFSRLNIGNTYLEKGKYTKALNTYHEALEKAEDPTDKANVHTQIGFTQWRLGQTDEALGSFKESLKYRGDQYLVMTWLNEIYKDRNDEAERLRSLKQNYETVKNTMDTNPTRLIILANMSLWYEINMEETIHIINNILNTSDNPTAQMWGRYLLPLLYLKSNQLDAYHNRADELTESFTQILKTVPDVPRTVSVWRNFLIFNQYAYEHTDEGIEKYSLLINSCLDHKLKITEMVFRGLLSDVYFHTGQHEKKYEQLSITGIPEESKWWVIGPFDHKNGFNNKFPPEKRIKLQKSYQGKSQTITWQRAVDGVHEGYVDLQKICREYNWSVGYGLIYVESPEQKDVQLRVGTNDAAKIWLNDELVWKFNIGRDASFDDDIIKVTLKPGNNKILIKVCNLISLWGFYFRISDENGNGIPDLRFISADKIDE